MKSILVTGGCGFIGSAFVNKLLASKSCKVYNIDCLNYCSTKNNIDNNDDPLYTFIYGDITNKDLVSNILQTYKIDILVHFAAQSHVDTSFSNPLSYTKDNIYGTHVLLECCKDYKALELFLHISTDEVYGDIGTDKKNENSVLCPTNPYAATKASAELIVKSYFHSFNMPIVIVRSNNVYGPKQFNEKVIPKFITSLLNNKAITIHGSGENKRSFIYVDDAVNAIDLVMNKGASGEVYNIGSEEEISVIQLAALLQQNMHLSGKLEYVTDRPYNDKRYFICDKKLRSLGWEQHVDFSTGLTKTIDWYKQFGVTHWS